MKLHAFSTLRHLSAALSLLVPFSAYAQNGDNKKHHSMDEIVPRDIIPPAPVLSVDEALKAFTIAEGFVIEPVAAEPLVDKPVALTFDSKGRMWVCEMRGYMPDIDGKGEDVPMGRIAILEDTDGDGAVDQRTTFLDELMLPRAIHLVPDGVLFADQNYLYHVTVDGDKPVGEPRIIDQKFAEGGNVEHKTNGLMLNIDNWLYNSKSNKRFKFTDGKLTKEDTVNRGQWGISRDNLGRIYHNSNSTMLVGDHLLPNLLMGNPLVKMKTSINSRLGSNAVYPGRINPGLNRAYISTLNGYGSNTIDPKTFKLINCTGACGPVFYRGTNFPTKFDNYSFICESSAQLVKAVEVDVNDGKLSGSHPYEKREFLTSTDERFRPVNMYNAPDGSLYLLDMYHGIIQHRTYMTSYLREQTLSRGLDQPGVGHGRIYRIRHTSGTLAKVPDLSKAEPKELYGILAGKNGVLRDLAQKELIERKVDPKALRTMLADVKDAPVSAMHLIWTLEGLGALRPDDLHAPLKSESKELVASALYASLSMSDPDRSPIAEIVASLEPSPVTLPYQARVLASIPGTGAQEALVKLLLKHKDSNFIQEAAISGLEKNSQLFTGVNNGRFSTKKFDAWLKQSNKGPQEEIDPSSFLKGDHLASFNRGRKLYFTTAACIGCHGEDGTGLENLGPHLDKSDWVTGSDERLVKILLHGLTGPIKINGETFTPVAFMPGLGVNPTIKDQDIADVATFIRANWSNRAPQISEKRVAEVRSATKDRAPGEMYTQKDFE